MCPSFEVKHMNPNPVGSLLLIALLVLSVWAIFGANRKWKLFNLLVIVAGMGFGLGLGFLAGLWSRNMAIGGELAVTFMSLFGAAAGYICLRRNTRRKAAG